MDMEVNESACAVRILRLLFFPGTGYHGSLFAREAALVSPSLLGGEG
jgi:hypothetical protein